jgi:hypothetical protein
MGNGSDDYYVKVEKQVSKLFTVLENSNAKNVKQTIFKDFGLKLIKEQKYPKIEFNLSVEEIRQLKETGILTDENKFNKNLADGKTMLDPLSKILYAMLWKNGDLGKEHVIIDGIENTSKTFPKNSLVFFQFGRYLENHNEPIIDQHVLRCFLIRNEKDCSKIREYLSLASIDKYENKINEYKKWVKNTVKKGIINQKDIDEILFAYGRKLKRESNKR